MKLFNKIKNKINTKYQILGHSIYKTETLITAKRYFFLGINFYKKIIKPDIEKNYILGIKVYTKKKDIITPLLQYAQNSEFLYVCFHTGDFYYLCEIIKDNFERFKDVKILSNFEYLKQVLELFDIDKEWIKNNFIKVPQFYPSTVLWCDKDGKIIKKIEIDHNKGWCIDNILCKTSNCHNSLKNNFYQFVGEEEKNGNRLLYNCKPDTDKENKILFAPESQFNGELDFEFCKKLIDNLQNEGYKIFINTKSDKYNSLLNDNVSKIFLSLKETYLFASNCTALIGVRSGFFDCLQTLINNEVKFFVIYNKISYPHYRHFKNFYQWFKEVYSFNLINNTNKFKEYFYENDLEKIEKDILKELRIEREKR